MKEIKSIFVEGTSRSPQADFDQLTGNLILSGKSIPENAAKVYEPLLNWVTEYIRSPHKTTNLRLNLVYYNTASSLWIAKIIKALSNITKADHVLYIHLYVDLEDSESMDIDEVKDLIGSLTANVGEAAVSIGVLVHAVDDNGKIVKDLKVYI